MAERKIELAEAFIQAHPEDAARVVEQLSSDDLLQILQHLPIDTSARLLQALLPQYAARIAMKLDQKLAIELLSQVEPALTVVILRHMPRGRRKGLLDGLPTKAQAASALLLNYNVDTVGAWMNPKEFTLPDDCTVEEALGRLAAEPGIRSNGFLFIVTRQLKVRGMTQLPNLLRAAPESPILSLSEAAPPALPGRATLLSVRKHAAWDSFDIVPVLNRHQQFVGALTHARLRQGLAEITDSLPEPVAGDAASGIAEIYGGTLFALLESVGQASGLLKDTDRSSR